MPIDHSYVQVATDGSGKKVANVQQTDPDSQVVHLQKTVTWDPETATDGGGQRVDSGAARTGSADGGHATIGTTTDAEATGDGSLVALLKRLRTLLAGGLPASLGQKTMANSLAVTVASDQSAVPVSATDLDIRDLSSASDSVSAAVTSLPNEGQQTMANSISVAVASDQSAVPTNSATASTSATWTTSTAVDATLSLALSGHEVVAVQATGSSALASTGGGRLYVEGSADGGTSWVPLLLTFRYTQGSLSAYDFVEVTGFADVSDIAWLPAAGLTHVRARLDTAQITAGTLALVLRASAGRPQPATSMRVEGLNLGDAGLANPIPIAGRVNASAPADATSGLAQHIWLDPKGRQHIRTEAGTATLTNVNDTASSTTLLSANSARLGAMIQNDSTAVLYVKFGTTASTTSYTVKMSAGAYYEVPFGYTGRIDGIWASDASGAARITELT